MFVNKILGNLLIKWFTRRITKNLKFMYENDYIIHMTKDEYTAHQKDHLCSICCHNCNLTEFDPDRWTLFVDERQAKFMEKSKSSEFKSYCDNDDCKQESDQRNHISFEKDACKILLCIFCLIEFRNDMRLIHPISKGEEKL